MPVLCGEKYNNVVLVDVKRPKGLEAEVTVAPFRLI
jgi:hypothetical protein